MSEKNEGSSEDNNGKASASVTKRKHDAEADENVLKAKRLETSEDNSSVLITEAESISHENTEKTSGSPKPPTTIFSLNTYCWIKILSYLHLGDQIRLSAANRYLNKHFEPLESTYKHINDDVTASLNKADMQLLLELVNENVISYESSLRDGEEHLWLLRTYCPQVRHLKMTFRRPRIDLKELKSLTSLHACLFFANAKFFKDFFLILMELPRLKKLNLKADNYNGSGLHVLEDLEYLDLSGCPAFDAECLAECCLKLKKLRHLNMGRINDNLTADNFRVIVKNCRNLERLVISEGPPDLPYDIICQLPRLKHLKVWNSTFLTPTFTEKLIQRTGTPLESLILMDYELKSEQMDHICEISSLRELYVVCETFPLDSLMKLKNLEILHLTAPDITNQQLLAVLEGCPLLSVLNLPFWRLITKDFFLDATRLYKRKKIQINLPHPPVNFLEIHISKNNKFINFTHQYYFSPILINQELCDSN